MQSSSAQCKNSDSESESEAENETGSKEKGYGRYLSVKTWSLMATFVRHTRAEISVCDSRSCFFILFLRHPSITTGNARVWAGILRIGTKPVCRTGNPPDEAQLACLNISPVGASRTHVCAAQFPGIQPSPLGKPRFPVSAMATAGTSQLRSRPRSSHSASSLRLIPQKSPCVSGNNSSSNLMQRQQHQVHFSVTDSDCSSSVLQPNSKSSSICLSHGALLSSEEALTSEHGHSTTLHEALLSVRA